MMDITPWKLSVDYAYRSWMHSQQNFYNSELARKVLYLSNPSLELSVTRRATEALKTQALKNADNVKVANTILQSIPIPLQVHTEEPTKKYSQRQLIDLLNMSKWDIAKCFKAKNILGVPIKLTRKSNIKAILTNSQLKKIKHLGETQIANDDFDAALKRGKDIIALRNKGVEEKLLRFEILLLYGNLFGRQKATTLKWDTFFDSKWNQGALFYLKSFPMPYKEYEECAQKIEYNKWEWAQLHEEYWRNKLDDYLDTNNAAKHEEGLGAKTHMNMLCVFFDKMFSGISSSPLGTEDIEVSDPRDLAFIISTYFNHTIGKIDLILDSCPIATGPYASGSINYKITDLIFDLYTGLGQSALELDEKQFSAVSINSFKELIDLIPGSKAVIDAYQVQVKKEINASEDIDDEFKVKFLIDIENAIYKSDISNVKTSHNINIAQQLSELMLSYPIDAFSITDILAEDTFSDLYPIDDIRFIDFMNVERLRLLKYILIVTAFANAVPEDVEKLSYMSGKKYTVRKTRVDLLSHKNLGYLLGISETKVRKLMGLDDEITDIVKTWNKCKTKIRSD